MADEPALRPPTGTIPTEPGVYRFHDASGRVIYVGKAKNLRSRLSSYFQDPAALHPRTQTMVATARSVDWVVVGTEVEALTLEYAWIKEFDPRFNVKFRDDKSYPYLAFNLADPFPRVAVVREARKAGTRYFGPYAHAWAIRETVDELLRVFPVRSCRDGVFRRAKQVGRPCLLGYIDKCSAPCVGSVTEDEHRGIVLDFCAFLSGNGDGFIRELERQMGEAAAQERYEEAGRMRDRIGALRRATERNAVAFNDDTDADLIAVSEDPLEAGVQVFHVRGGRIRGERGFVVEKAEELAPGEVIARAITRLYSEPGIDAIPREILVCAQVEDASALEAWLAVLRDGPVHLRVPARGDKKALMDTAMANAAHTLQSHRMKRSSDLTTRSIALEEIREALGLAEAPLRIECIDISTLLGANTVASLVVFEDGLPRKSDYRSFIIRTPDADDTASVAEVVRRRFAKSADEAAAAPEPGEERRRFAYPPGLLVIDGGQPQVRAAQDALMAAGVTTVPVIGLAKRLEEVWLPDDLDPLILPRSSEGLYLLQRVRDEAHRTAIALHRKRRGRSMSASILDDVPGLGQAKAKALLKHFGTIKALRAATIDELQGVSGIGPSLASRIHGHLHTGSEAS
ncbi:MAG: excinuclease ABC subunit UvrC [Candidatus Nanopelagicales bacterium]|nr:excinuclease ABC subunit UvrC [Candidatus Nanopelagicales bacterium]